MGCRDGSPLTKPHLLELALVRTLIFTLPLFDSGDLSILFLLPPAPIWALQYVFEFAERPHQW